MNRRDLPRVVLDLRHAAELIAHPCNCGRLPCSIGDHLWGSTRDMAPGLKSTNTDPKVRAWPTDGDDTRPDSTSLLHVEYRRRLVAAQQAARQLQDFIDANRPDRTVPVPTSASDTEWCRVCLDYGICAPRHRGDLCRDCYDFHLAYRPLDRPGTLVIAKHEGRRITQSMVDAAVKEARRELRRKRRTA